MLFPPILSLQDKNHPHNAGRSGGRGKKLKSVSLRRAKPDLTPQHPAATVERLQREMDASIVYAAYEIQGKFAKIFPSQAYTKAAECQCTLYKCLYRDRQWYSGIHYVNREAPSPSHPSTVAQFRGGES